MPAFFNNSYVLVATVVLPLVPVIAINFVFLSIKSNAKSISDIILILFLIQYIKNSLSQDIPGLFTTISSELIIF